MTQYFLIDAGNTMPTWCQPHRKKDGSGFQWMDFKSRSKDLQTGTVLAVAIGDTMDAAIASVPEDIVRLEQELASLHLLDPWSEQGWISPTGKFYGCKYYTHDDLAYALLRKSPYELEDSGWLRVHEDFYVSKDIVRLSRAQIRTLTALGFINPPEDTRRDPAFKPDRRTPPPRYAVMAADATLTNPRFSERIAPPMDVSVRQIKDRLRNHGVLSEILDLSHEEVLDFGPGTWSWLLHWDDFDIGCPYRPSEILEGDGVAIYMTSFDTLEIQISPHAGILLDEGVEAFLESQLNTIRSVNHSTPATF